MFSIGTVLNDKYRIKEVVGTGGMAVVYLAEDLALGENVAVKVLRSEFESDEEFSRRFEREAEAASKMYHENIVRVLDIGRQDGQRYIVMEYIDGITLKNMIRRDGCIRTDAAIRIILRILAALDHAHKNGIVHRDIKPQNILVDKRGQVKVTDFGIARLKANQTTKVDDKSVSALGSVHYFSPEQARGEMANEQSDLYSTGIVFYEMLTGKVPFDGETSVSIALKHINETPVSMLTLNPSIPKALDEVVMRAIAKDPNRRYQTAEEMAADLVESTKHPKGGFVKYPPTPEELQKQQEERRLRRLKQRKRALAILAVTAAVVLLAVGVTVMWYVNERMDTVLMPDLYGISEYDAEQALLEAGLDRYEFSFAYSEDAENGLCFAQEPAAGSHVRPDTPLSATFSKGSRWYTLADLTGVQVSDVLEYFSLRNVTDVTVEYVFSSLEEGAIVSQLPAAGTVSREDPVTLNVSGRHVFVPSVTGILLDDALSVLEEEGLAAGSVLYTYSPDYESGIVLGQSEVPKTEVLVGYAVDLTVCGKPSVYYPEHDVVVDLAEPKLVLVEAVMPNRQTVECFRGVLEAGEHVLDISSSQKGSHVVKVYVDDVQINTYLVDFE